MCVYVCVCVCMCVCVCVCMYVCMCVCVKTRERYMSKREFLCISEREMRSHFTPPTFVWKFTKQNKTSFLASESWHEIYSRMLNVGKEFIYK